MTRGRYPFKIRPLSSTEQVPTPGERAPPPAPVVREDTEAKDETIVGALFGSPRAALDFLTALASRRLADHVTCARDGGRLWWIEAATSPEGALAAAEACRGVGYIRHDGAWHAAESGDRLSDFASGAPALFNPDSWQTVAPADLAAEIPFPERAIMPLPSVTVLVPAAQAPMVVRRAFAIGADADRLVVDKRALGTDIPAGGGVLLRLRRAAGTFSKSFLEMLCDLPHTLVAVERGGLLLDIRFAQAVGILPDMIAEGEIWAIGQPDAGRWRLQPLGEPEHAATLLNCPGPVNAVPVSLPDPGPIAGSTSLHVVSKPGVGTRVDALLLDARDLERFARFVRGRPVAETTIITPGADRFFAYSPGGFGDSAPFGIVLERIGPGAVFLEADCALDPPLPRSARATLFPSDGDTAQVLTREGFWRFDLSHAQPVWKQWLSEPPVIRDVLPEELKQFAAAVALIAVEERAKAEAAVVRPQKPRDVEDARKLIAAARRAELHGDLIGAAEAMERAGEFLAAARLYERAAAEAKE